MSKKKAGKTKRSDGLQPIMIDLEVHKAIEAERRNFDERPNAILRRLLGLDHEEMAAVSGSPETSGDAGMAGPSSTQMASNWCFRTGPNCALSIAGCA